MMSSSRGIVEGGASTLSHSVLLSVFTDGWGQHACWYLTTVQVGCEDVLIRNKRGKSAQSEPGMSTPLASTISLTAAFCQYGTVSDRELGMARAKEQEASNVTHILPMRRLRANSLTDIRTV